MPSILSSSVQSRWKDCYAPSPRVRLTLRTNGEELTQVITPQNAMVKAGFDAPTVAASSALGTAGALTGWVCYRYVYASSRYPFVSNAVTGGGQLWPRSIPSSGSAPLDATADRITVTVTKTTRSDVDWIWIYRTGLKNSSAEAQADSDAGIMFYVDKVANDGIPGTAIYSDNNGVDTDELLELDNYVAPTMQFCVFDGTQWWGIGNFPFDYTVTVNSTSSVTLTGYSAWFNGRDGQTATFDGITTGGYDGRGSFYFKWVTATTASMYSDAALTNLVVVPFNGTTKIHLKGFASTLYRSKPLNPFSWGQTDVTFTTDSSGNQLSTSVASEFALNFGYGTCTAMSLVGNDAYLVLSFEEPARMIRLSLDQSGSDAFAQTAKDIDTQSSFGSHFSQVLARFEGGQSTLSGVDAKNFDLMSTGGDSAQPISDSIFQTLRTLYPDISASRLFHSIYDGNTELTCFWVKTRNLGGNLIDTALIIHGPTGRWSLMADHQVSSSATIFDPQTKSSFTMLGMENGDICTGFDTSTFANIVQGAEWASGLLTQATNNLSMPNVLTTATSITASGSSWLVTAVTGKQKVGLRMTLDFFDVSNALLGSGTVTAVTLVQAVAGDYYTFLVTSSATLTTATQYSVDASSANGLWMFVHPVSQTASPQWVRLAAGVSITATHTWTPDFIYSEGDTDGYSRLSGAGAALTGATGYVGCIPCRHRRYFDLDEPTKAKSIKEVWATMQNVTTHYCRIFEEFDTALLNNFRFALTQMQRGGGNPSLCWNTKTNATQTLQTAMGFEILELGYQQWRNYNYTLKFQPEP